MQRIARTLRIAADGQEWVDRLGVETDEPVVFIGAKALLEIDLRGERVDEEGELPVYDIGQFADVASWYLAVDGDFNQATTPVLLKTSGIGVESVEGRTVLSVELPNTDSAGMRTALATQRSVQLTLEIGGLDGDGAVVACLQCALEVRNRVWLGDTVPEEVTSDPEYLTGAQVAALVNAAVAEAALHLVGAPGETGPAPVIEIGSVTSGATATAELVEGEAAGSYLLNLVLPRGGDAAAPLLSVGTVVSGTEADAELVEDGEGWRLNLVLPRGLGLSHQGVWSAENVYAANDAVRHGGTLWMSLADDNEGNVPADGSEFWGAVVKDGAGMEMRYGAGSLGPWHSAPIAAGDTHFCISEDGGATWSEARPLSQPGVSVCFGFNQDAVSDWEEAVAGEQYSSATGQYMRLTSALGVVSSAYDVTNGAGAMELRMQFSDESGDWHAELAATDTKVRVFTADSVLRKIVSFNLGEGDSPARLEFCRYEDPWHGEPADGDRFWRVSQDGGATWSAAIPLSLDEAPSDGGYYVRRNGAWVAMPGATSTVDEDEVYAPGAHDLPEHSERRIWEYLTFPRPNDERELEVYWQTSMDGVTWSRELNSMDQPGQAFMHSGGLVTAFDAGTAQDACLKTEHIAPCHVHVRLCWGYVENGEAHRGDWIYRNTLGVVLSAPGEAMERPQRLNPEYFVIPIPEDAEHCAIQLSASGEWYGEQYWFTDRHYSPDAQGAMFFFDGRGLVENTDANAASFPTSFVGPATAGQWLVFRRRGIPKYHVRAVWTGATPAVFEWSPEEA